MQAIQADADRMFLVRCSFLELYNEELRDLAQEGTPSVRLRIHPKVRRPPALRCHRAPRHATHIAADRSLCGRRTVGVSAQ